MPASTILLLASDADTGATSIKTILSGAGYVVTVVADPDEALPRPPSTSSSSSTSPSGPKTAIEVCARSARRRR